MFKFTSSKAKVSHRHIAFVIERLAARGGGAERVLIETANEMARRGHSVEIISHEYRGKRPFYDLEYGVRLTNLRRHSRTPLNGALYNTRAAIERLHALPVFSQISWISRHGAFWRRLERHLQHTNPDAVVAFMPPAISALGNARLGSGIRKIASTHNAPIHDFHNPERWDPSKLDQQRRLRLLEEMDVTAVLLPEYRDWHSERIRHKTVVLPNAVSELPSETLTNAKREKVVVSVGRLASVKRHETLLRAWALISKTYPDWKLRIYGEGPLKQNLDELILDLGLRNAVLCGHTSDIAEAYLSGKILAHPAEFEGFPLAVTEALASGMPVVGFSDCSGLNRLVVDGFNGVLIDDVADRVTSFALALSRLMADEERISQLSEGGPSSMKKYAPENVYNQWEEILFGDIQGLALPNIQQAVS